MMITIFEIHKKLGLNLENGLFIRKTITSSNANIEDLYEGNFSEYKSNFKVEYVLKKLQPHSFFLFNNEPLLLFFDFQEVQITKEELSQKIWNFNKSALAFINYQNELIVYNGFHFDKKRNLLKTLETIKTINELTKIEQFSYWRIVTAELWNAQDTEFKKKTRVDTKLLENIKTTREALRDIYDGKKLSEKHANRIIGRLIFIRYLIDRNVNLDYKGKGKELLSKNDLPKLILQKDCLFDFFEYLLNKFKGDILPLNGERETINNYHLEKLSNLFAGAEIRSGQQSLFNIFDFDFIPIELISNIYETFLGEKQDSDKAFYTPPFLVDYILEQTVKPFVENQSEPDKLSCKTVDFTCGSGIFLCETLRTIIHRYINLAVPDKSTNEFKEKIKQLLIDNIYGNDINMEAVEIAKFSLFITLLDYFEDPKDIEHFEFPDVSKNFFNCDIFETELNTDCIFKSPLDNIFGKEKQIEPDFIIGNPPWGKLNKKCPYLQYIKQRNKKENLEIKKNLKEKYKPINIEISNNEFAQAFLLRLSDFSTHDTTCQIIVTSKLLYNLQANNFRNYFLNNFMINEVLEISSVRHQIFSNAVGPAAIIKYHYAFGNDTKDNKIDYVSLKPNPYFAIFKSILIEKHDFKEVIQKELIKNDWLWNVLVYGHILDYRFVERLRDKNEFPIVLGELIENKDNKNRLLKSGTGIIIGNKKYNISKYIGKLFVNTNNKETKRSDLQRYYIYYHPKNTWPKERNKAEGKRNDNNFLKPPYLFLKQGLSENYSLVSSISHIQAIYTFSIFSLREKNQNSGILENIVGILNSSLINHYLLTDCVSSIIRERLTYQELFPFPIIKSITIVERVKHLIKLKRLIAIHNSCQFKNNIKIAEYQHQFDQSEIELNKIIFDLYKLSNTERDLISYSQEITIPLIQAKNKTFREIRGTPKLFKPYKEIERSEIIEYLNIFKEHFNKLHNSGERGYFNVKVIQSKNILACEFSIDKEKLEDIWRNFENNDIVMDLFVGLGFQKVSNGLFIQKDLKSLKRNSFIVAKPKQYKYWHKAIARLDVIEFMEAMMQSHFKTTDGKNQ